MEAGAGKQNAVVVIVVRRYAGFVAGVGLVLLHPLPYGRKAISLPQRALLFIDPPWDLTCSVLLSVKSLTHFTVSKID